MNNAAYGAFGALESSTEAEIKQQSDVNFFGLIEATKALLPVANKKSLFTEETGI